MSQLFDIKATGVQFLHTVVLTVTGKAPTPGHKVKLSRSPVTVFPPEFTLTDTPPTKLTIQIPVPFSVHAQFTAKERVKEVKVRYEKNVYVAKVKIVKGPISPGK